MMIQGESGLRQFVFNPPSDDSARANAVRLERERDAAMAAWRAAHNKEAESSRRQGRFMPDSLL